MASPPPAPPAGYHYLGQPASIITDSNGIKKSTQLLLVDNTKLQKQRYASFYSQVGKECWCALGCKKTFTKHNGTDMKGVISFLRCHTWWQTIVVLSQI